MDASYCVSGSDMDFGRMFDQYLHKRHPQPGYPAFDSPTDTYPDMASLAPTFNPQVPHTSSNMHNGLPPSHQQHSIYPHQMSGMHAPNNPQFPPQNMYIPPISQHALLASQTTGYHPYLQGVGHGNPVYTSAGLPLPSTHTPMMNVAPMLPHNSYYHHPPRPPINHNGGSPISVGSPSPNSEDSDDAASLAQMNKGKRPTTGDVPDGNKKKTKVTKKNKKKKDPNEPQKPVSAYALFFRDTQATIKGANPNASFGEISKIVASMWDSLDAENKGVYKKKTEAAKKEYLKALAAYRASLVSKGGNPSLGSNTAIGSTSETNTGLMPSHNQTSHGQVKPIENQNQTQHQQQQQQLNHHTQQTPTTQQQPQPSPQVPPQSQQSQGPQSQSHHLERQVSGSAALLHQQMGVNAMAVPQPHGMNGCAKMPENDWNEEYCANPLVVNHCRNVYQDWAATQGTDVPQAYPGPVK